MDKTLNRRRGQSLGANNSIMSTVHRSEDAKKYFSNPTQPNPRKVEQNATQPKATMGEPNPCPSLGSVTPHRRDTQLCIGQS